MLRYLVNMIVAVLPPTRAFGFKRFLWLRIGAVVGDGAQINAGARIWGGGPVTVGRDTWLGMNLCIIVPAGSEVTIGSNVDIGPDVMIECGSHDVGGPERRAGILVDFGDLVRGRRSGGDAKKRHFARIIAGT